jgi:hypothetical protein
MDRARSAFREVPNRFALPSSAYTLRLMRPRQSRSECCEDLLQGCRGFHEAIGSGCPSYFGRWLLLADARPWERAHEGDEPIVSNLSNKDPADAGKELRRMMLTLPPQGMGVSPTKEFPRR